MTAPLPLVGVVGAGAMGGAIMSGLVRAGWRPADVRFRESDPVRAGEVVDSMGVSPSDLAGIAACDVVVVAVKPHHVLQLMDELHPLVHGGPGAPVVVSIAAGVTTRAIQARLPHGVPVVRVMPNTPALVGSGMSVLSGGVHARDEHLDLAERVMSAVGATQRVPEAQQDAVTALSGSGPAYVFYVVDAMAEAGVLLGLPRGTARELAVQTVLGAARMLDETGTHPVELREQVTSPGGTTAAALRVLDERGVRAALVAAVEAGCLRSRDLGLAEEHPRV